MKPCALASAALWLLAARLPAAPPAAAPAVAWSADVDQAWQQAVRHNKPLLVLLTTARCAPCARLKLQVFAAPRLAAQVNADFIPLALDGQADLPLVKELSPASFPALFVISPQAVVLARVDGCPTADQLAARLSAVNRAGHKQKFARAP
jgi:hypothetical protein